MAAACADAELFVELGFLSDVGVTTLCGRNGTYGIGCEWRPYTCGVHQLYSVVVPFVLETV